ncbi:MAG: MBL fold metallo-hydrolase [Candidatus Thorarchaeota archaeon]
MELLWIGHSGILIRSSNVLIAIDPFLTGWFDWLGKRNFYHGKSPWIGTSTKNANFLESYGKKLTAIAITHKHGDHLDLPFIEKILKENSIVKIYAPKTVIKSIKSSIVKNLSFEISKSRFVTVKSNREYEIVSNEEKLKFLIIPLTQLLGRIQKNKVAYLIINEKTTNLIGLLHSGDSHTIKPLKPYLQSITHLLTWSSKDWLNELVKYLPNMNLKFIWWIHWENFSPGNFHCNQDIKRIMAEFSNYNIPQGVLPFNHFVKLK